MTVRFAEHFWGNDLNASGRGETFPVLPLLTPGGHRNIREHARVLIPVLRDAPR